MTGLAKVGVWIWRACLIASFDVLLALPLSAESSSDISELERYKRRLQSLEGSSDPARVAQLQQMQRLLTLMQRSLIIKEANSKPQSSEPKPAMPEPVEAPKPSPLPEQQPVPQPVGSTVEPKPAAVKAVMEPLPEVVPALPRKQAPVAVVEPVPDPPEPEIPAWFFQVELSTSIGYQENILRSAFSDLDSAFIRGKAELQLLNLRREDFRVMALGHYDRKFFLDESSVRDEDLLLMLGQVDRRIAGDVWLGLQLSYFSANQPLDDPDLIDLDTGSIPLKFDQLSISPQLTWEPSKEHAWVAHLDFRRETTDGLEIEEQDNDQWGMGLNYTFEPSLEHRFQLNYQFTEIDYDERRARSSSGTFLDDTLETRRYEWSASYRRTWEREESRWRAEARLRWILDDDEVGGYDDVARLEVRGRLSWRYRKRTEVLAELRYGEYFYDSRERSVDDMRHRERSYWVGSLTVEHAFNKRLAGLFRYEFRENAGNNSVDRYSTQILSTGICFTF
ncbi:MAG: hypothetical protein ABF370_18945 [Verrucomicrobiales bacterium]